MENRLSVPCSASASSWDRCGHRDGAAPWRRSAKKRRHFPQDSLTQIGACHRRHGEKFFQLATSVASPPRRSDDGCSRCASPGPSQPASLAAQGRTDCLAQRQKPRAHSVPATAAVGATMSRYVPPNPPWGRLPLASRRSRQKASSRDAEPGQSVPRGRQRIYVVRPTICRPLIDVGACAMASSG